MAPSPSALLERKTIVVAPAEYSAASASVFALLERVFPVRFVDVATGAEAADGWICREADARWVEKARGSRRPTLLLAGTAGPSSDRASSTSTAPATLAFSGTPSQQPFLRGAIFSLREHPPLPLPSEAAPSENGLVATINDRPVWWETVVDGIVHRRTCLAPSPPKDGQPIFPEFLSGGWIRWLPLFHFVRQITSTCDWSARGVSACFMFDDPNLHWHTWGFIDYRKMVRHADEHGYHVSMATVPADLWFAHRPTAELFRSRADRISLLVHGILHTHAELQRPLAPEVRRRHLAWGLNRIAAFESRYGVRISRVMAPPHHACSSEAAQLMLEAGLEAACVSWTALMRWNPSTPRPPEFGMGPAEFLGRGFPVIPRFNFPDQDRARAMLAHLFRQPIVMIGHHYDVADGLGTLAEWARWVSGFGDVAWTDMETIARSHFLERRRGDTLAIRLGSRRVRVDVPAGVRSLIVERPWWSPDLVETVECVRPRRSPEACRGTAAATDPIPVTEGEVLEIRCVQSAIPSPLAPGRFSRIWPMTRRVLCEVRDRLQPLPRRLRGA